MATILSPVDAREVVRCDLCQLVQFALDSNVCRRCHAALDAEPEPPLQLPAITIAPQPFAGPSALGNKIRLLRIERGWSQRQLAQRFKLPRTYASKIERGRTTPTLATLEKIALALGVGVAELVDDSGVVEEQVRELLRDPFLAELYPFVARLTLAQMWRVLGRVQDLSANRTRSNKSRAWLRS